MSEAEPLDASDNVMDFYRSIHIGYREVDASLVDQITSQNLYPLSLRYEVVNDACRGAFKSTTGDFYYFISVPGKEIKLVKAQDDKGKREAIVRLVKGQIGCDMRKASDKPDQDDEDEKKAEGATGMPLLPATRPEADNVATQNAQITEDHPGATAAQTPQQDGSTERWHGPQVQKAWTHNDLLAWWGNQMQETAPKVNPIDPQMRNFMIDVMGKTPTEVDAGRVYMNPMQRAQYNQWLTKSLRSRMSGLHNILKKGV